MSSLPTPNPAAIREYLRKYLSEGRTNGEAAQGEVFLFRAQPQWLHDPELIIDATPVLVRTAISPLAALDSIAEFDRRSRGEYLHLVVLTAHTEQQLGEAVISRAYRGQVLMLDEWSTVPTMFGARALGPELRELSWAPRALLEHRPTGGWPSAVSSVVTAEHAIGALLATLLGTKEQLDEIGLVQLLDTSAGRTHWRNVAPELRKELIAWSRSGLGTVATLALQIAEHRDLWVMSVGLAADALWAQDTPENHPDVIAARVRQEQSILSIRQENSAKIAFEDLKKLADATRSIALRRQQRPGESNLVEQYRQAEELLGQYGWAVGASHSSILPAGLTHRLHKFAKVLETALDKSPVVQRDDLQAAEAAFGELMNHQLVRSSVEITSAHMALRLLRWLATEPVVEQELPANASRYLNDIAWADRAFSAVWNGSADEQVSQAYTKLLQRVGERRSTFDENLATTLAQTTERDIWPKNMLRVENLLEELAKPLAINRPLLLLVIDGLSAAITTELVENLQELGWNEYVTEHADRRQPALAVTPTVTAASRTSLLTGQLRVGTQADEKRYFPALAGGPVFHKADLQSTGGSQFGAAVEPAINDTKNNRIVAVVLNTIDDALKTTDPSAIPWNSKNIQHLHALLSRAHQSGRDVLITSDHGHVIDRRTEPPTRKNAEARWRPNTADPGPGEIQITGPRVLTPENSAILPWKETIAYTPRQAGYHGGASAAELIVPVILLSQSQGSIPGWRPAPPMAPLWWNEELKPSAPLSTMPTEKTSKKKPAPVPENQTVLDVAVPTEPAQAPPAGGDMAENLSDAVLNSAVYKTQRQRTGRAALADTDVRDLLTALLQYDCRLHRDSLASLLKIPSTALLGRLSIARRTLNVDGYPVLETIDGGETIRLDLALLKEQFEVSGG